VITHKAGFSTITAFGALFCLLSSSLPAQDSGPIPAQLWGTWRIARIIPTRTISCWGDREARQILGSTIEYSLDSFRWKNHVIRPASTTSKVWTADEFRSEYSGGGPNDSQADFRQLGISESKITMVSIKRPDADITGGTTEIPGDAVLLAAKGRIIFSVCNVYFEAVRTGTKNH
jgi:hypothetical protein